MAIRLSVLLVMIVFLILWMIGEDPNWEQIILIGVLCGLAGNDLAKLDRD